MTTAVERTDDRAYLFEDGVESRYRISKRTLQRWRSSGDGPPFVRVGLRRVMYRVADVEDWLANRTFRSRAEELSRKITPPSGRKHTDRRLAETNEASLQGRVQRQPVEETPSATPEEAKWLARIRASPLGLTLGKAGTGYFLQNGMAVPAAIARSLIVKGLVEPCGNGLFGDSRTFRVPRQLEQD